MSSSTNNNYINDTKKKESNKTQPDYKKFYIEIIYSIINVIVSIFIGCMFLYMCKITQSQSLIQHIQQALSSNKYNSTYVFKEDDVENEKIPLTNNLVDINVVKQYSGFLGKLGFSSKKPEIYTTKVLFDDSIETIQTNVKILENLKNKIYNDDNNISETKYNTLKKELNQNKEKDKKQLEPVNNKAFTFMLWYVYNIILSSLSSTLWLHNIIFNFLGKYVTESIILILFSLFGISSFFVLFVVVLFITFFNTILNVPKIYDSRTYKIHKDGSKKDIVETPQFIFDAKNLLYIVTLPNIFLFFLLFFGILFVFFISIFNFIYFLYLILSNTGKVVKEDKSTIPFDFTTFLKYTLQYKSQILMLLFSYNIYKDVIQNLGSNYVLSFVIAILIFLVFTHVFESYQMNPQNDSIMTKGFSTQSPSQSPSQSSNLSKPEYNEQQTTSKPEYKEQQQRQQQRQQEQTNEPTIVSNPEYKEQKNTPTILKQRPQTPFQK